MNSFQKEIPRARVNITLDVETNGAQQKRELPLKLLALGDFSQGRTKGGVATRERININAVNFNRVLADLAPELNFVVPNKIKHDGSEFKVKLKLTSINGFHPESIVREIPELRNLLAMRNLLKDLKSNLLDNNTLRRRLEQIVKNQAELSSLHKELQQKVGASCHE